MTRTCEQPAFKRMCWPARDPMPVCLDHAIWAQRVAGAMGFHLPMIDAETDDTCTQQVNANALDTGREDEKEQEHA